MNSEEWLYKLAVPKSIKKRGHHQKCYSLHMKKRKININNKREIYGCVRKFSGYDFKCANIDTLRDMNQSYIFFK